MIICSYNRRNYITGAMESLYNQTLEKNKFEVIVVDNNSSDDTEKICIAYINERPDFNIKFLSESKQGASFARNTGAALAQFELLVFMDDDALAAPDYLERILLFFKAHPDAAGLGGKIVPKYIPQKPSWMSYYVSSLVGNFDYSKHAVEFKPGKYPLESNMIVTKKDFLAVGGFNTALPGVKGTLRIGGEGKDFFLKVQKLNKRIFYDPDIAVEHIVEVKKLTREYMYRVASGIGRGERVRTLAISRNSFFKKIVEYLFKLAASVIIGLGYIIQGTPKKALPVIHFRIDALKGLLGK